MGISVYNTGYNRMPTPKRFRNRPHLANPAFDRHQREQLPKPLGAGESQQRL